MCTFSQSAWSNIPAAYLACEGAEEGVDCVMTGPQYGACVLDTLCSDPSETVVNECLLCVDACWALPEGSECIRPFTGEIGICEAQDRCTDKVETSFQECMRCVTLIDEPQDRSVEPEGCQQVGTYRILTLGLLFLGILYTLRKPKQLMNDTNIQESNE